MNENADPAAGGGTVVSAGFERAPKENADLGVSCAFSADTASLPVSSWLASWLSLMISLTGFPKAAKGLATGRAEEESPSFFSFSFSAPGVTTSVGLIAGADEVEDPKEKDGRGATLGASSDFALTIEAKKLGFSPSAVTAGRAGLGAGGAEVEGVANEKPLVVDLEVMRSVVGAEGLKCDAAGFASEEPKEIVGRGGIAEVPGPEAKGADELNEKVGLSLVEEVAATATGGAERRLS